MKNADSSKTLLVRGVVFVLVAAAVLIVSFLVGEHIRPAVAPGEIGSANIGAGPAGGSAASMRFIILKFALWFVFIILAAVMLRRRRWERREKIIVYGISLAAFGVFFGPEPSPMHPVKDFIFRLGAMGKPVLIFAAFFAVLLLVSIVVNRSICAWGCQFGVFQDLIHRIFRNKKDTKSVITAYKPPFWLSNTVRITAFLGMIFGAFVLSFDLFGSVDPFSVFSPGRIGLSAGIFAGVMLLASVFIYRPFCYFFCPFGLLSWLASRLSIIRIRINRESCSDCKVCVRACPSDAMRGIYEQKSLPPDCYTCGSCMAACPTQAVSLSGPGRK